MDGRTLVGLFSKLDAETLGRIYVEVSLDSIDDTAQAEILEAIAKHAVYNLNLGDEDRFTAVLAQHGLPHLEWTMDTQAHETLMEIQSALATLNKMAYGIDPRLCDGDDWDWLRLALAKLHRVEETLAPICADHNEAQEDEGDEFPFEAWDLLYRQRVTVLGWTKHFPGHYRMEPGYMSHPRYITTAFPTWYTEAQQLEADARDERETQRDALGAEVQ